jgi:hypothetical protein
LARAWPLALPWPASVAFFYPTALALKEEGEV